MKIAVEPKSTEALHAFFDDVPFRSKTSKQTSVVRMAGRSSSPNLPRQALAKSSSSRPQNFQIPDAVHVPVGGAYRQDWRPSRAEAPTQCAKAIEKLSPLSATRYIPHPRGNSQPYSRSLFEKSITTNCLDRKPVQNFTVYKCFKSSPRRGHRWQQYLRLPDLCLRFCIRRSQRVLKKCYSAGFRKSPG